MIEQIILDYDTAPEPLSYNSLINYRGRKKFRDVKSIEAKVNTEDLTLSFLGPMFPNLERLRLNNSIITSIRDIGCNFPKLRFLSLAQCNITSLDGIATISPNLQELYLAGNKIPDLVDLMGMNQLKIIDLEDNGISNFSTIEILQLCDKLTTLTLRKNPITIDPNYRKKIFELLPKLSYLDETRPSMSTSVRYTPPTKSNASTETNKQQSKQPLPTNQQNKQNVSQKTETNKQTQQISQSNKTTQNTKTTPTTQQKNDQTKQPSKPTQQKTFQPRQQIQQNKQNTQANSNQSAKPPQVPILQKVDQTTQQSNKTEKETTTATPTPANTSQNKRRAPSAAAASNAKKVQQSRQTNEQSTQNQQKKVGMPSSNPNQSSLKVHPPDDASKTATNNKGNPNKLTERSPRGSTSMARKARPNTKLVVNKNGSSAPSTPAKEPLKSDSQPKPPPRPPAKPIKQTVSPDDLFPTPPSPHAKQVSDRVASQKASDNQQFNDVKKTFSRTSGASSARKNRGKSRSSQNGDEIMTDMVHDLVEENNAESEHNKSCLYERSAFPELNSINVRKHNRSVKNPEIIKPLSARGPLYI